MPTHCARFTIAIFLAGIATLVGACAAMPASVQREDGATAPLALVKVVMVTRHGIRSGTKSAAYLARHGTRTWPAWPVAPGELTAHGATAIAHMGGWLRMHYAANGLFATTGCPGQATAMVWADNADKRTRDSGQAILDGMFPGCGMHAYWLPPGRHDPRFDGYAADPVDYATAVQAVRAHGNPDDPAPGYQRALARLGEVLGCQPQATIPACAWLRQSNRLVAKPDGSLGMDGPLHDAATLSEILLLEYAQGMPKASGVVSRATLREVLPLHTMYARLMRGTPYLAKHNAHALVAAILHALRSTPAPGPEGTATGARLLLYLGHDTNLSNLGALLGVEWTLPDEPDPTAPDTTMAFELLRDGAGRHFVRVRVYYQTLRQLRGAEVLDAGNPAGAVTLKPTGCHAGPRAQLCSLDQLRRLFENSFHPDNM